MVTYFPTRNMANDDFSEPPRRADPKNPIVVFAEFWVRVTSGARGVSLGKIWGGGGSSQTAVSTHAQLKARPPLQREGPRAYIESWLKVRTDFPFCPCGPFPPVPYTHALYCTPALHVCVQVSGMMTSAKGMLRDMFALVAIYGFVPNGNRVYYLNRSQPPLLADAVWRYFTETQVCTQTTPLSPYPEPQPQPSALRHIRPDKLYHETCTRIHTLHW